MNTKKIAVVSGLILASVLGCAVANPTTSALKGKDLFTTLASTRITLDEAIQTAEHTVSGKPVKATLDGDTTPAAYRVAIADSNTRTVTYIKIDSITGKVVDSRTYHTDKQSEKTGTRPGAAKTKSKAALPQHLSPPKPAATPATSATTKPVTPVATTSATDTGATAVKPTTTTTTPAPPATGASTPTPKP